MERLRIAITQGDTNGVGLEIILKAFADPTLFEICTPILYGNPRLATYHRKACNLPTNFSTIQKAEDAKSDRLNLLVVDDTETPVLFGQSTPESATQAEKALKSAQTDLQEGKVDALILGPSSINPTEQTGLKILVSERIRVALATTTQPISQVAKSISTESITQRIAELQMSLKRDFMVAAPRVAVLMLNPQADAEEKNVISPAIDSANAQGIRTFGPYAADTFFGTRMYENFDGVLAMYHDQGVAAFRAIARGEGAIYTAAQDVVVAAPDHDMMYNLAGKGEADENSLRQAIYNVLDVCRNRETYDEATAKPLEKLFHERREDERRPPRPRPEQSERSEAVVEKSADEA